ncbi:Heparinase II/III family protein [Lunatimonas lonarensis]|uniref:Heparinase II/III family protein n=1 Tax=Lunatimonas lonarensis TaxID=1232681 RepID=R7ZV19_9BACT|nr:heparinase II/III family protein [Lunatimonas lonarensis]EON77927.1 Heparinase II/III family protein [Lunatimonas lonarensis]
MKLSAFITLLLFSFVSLPDAAAQRLVSGKYAPAELEARLIPIEQWKPFPAVSDRSAWNSLDKATLDVYLETANENIDYEWPYIPATKSLLIERTGDRDEYQAVTFQKRRMLGTMMLAEIYENKGRFIDPIVNGIWSICEESFWGVPAHLPKTKEISGLIDVTRPFVDLFAAETATYLAWADYFFGEQFDRISPQIRKRIRHETQTRIFQPLMNQHHGWMTANSNGRPPNNWNPWIVSNWINAALLLEADQKKRTEMVHKAITVLDNFLDPYPQDGGCDEGPSYWGAAAASLFDCLSLLNLASGDAFDYVYSDEKVRNMGKFIYRAQLSEDYFLNFADADPQPKMSAAMIYRYGEAIQDPDMMRFGAYYWQPFSGTLPNFHYFRNFFELFVQDEISLAEKGLPLPKDVWLPDIEVMVARDQGGTTDGFLLAAKGGHNAESHNHNDIGNFVVYYDGQPLLIDVGRGTYTRKTFSEDRYTIWYNRSDHHNLPTVNGQVQLPGVQFKATRVTHQARPQFSQLKLDIGGAYPDAAGIESWDRTLILQRGRQVRLEDVIFLKEASKITHHFMTIYPPRISRPGVLVLPFVGKDGVARDFTLTYDAGQMEATVEKVPLEAPEDRGIISHWGDTIYRVNFEVKSPKKKDRFRFVIE